MWAFRNAGAVGTSFNAAVTPGTPAVINANDTLIIATSEYFGTNTRPTAPTGWVDKTLGVNWTTGSAVYMRIADGTGADAMPAITSWGNQFQAAVCLVYSGGFSSLANLVDTGCDRAYNTTNTLSFLSVPTPTNDNSLIVLISFKNTLGNASPVLTEAGVLVGFNRRVTYWPTSTRPTIVVDDYIQTTKTSYVASTINMNFTEASAQNGHSTIFVLNLGVAGNSLPRLERTSGRGMLRGVRI